MTSVAVKDLMETINLALENTSYSFSSSGLWLNKTSIIPPSPSSMEYKRPSETNSPLI